MYDPYTGLSAVLGPGLDVGDSGETPVDMVSKDPARDSPPTSRANDGSVAAASSERTDATSLQTKPTLEASLSPPSSAWLAPANRNDILVHAEHTQKHWLSVMRWEPFDRGWLIAVVAKLSCWTVEPSAIGLWTHDLILFAQRCRCHHQAANRESHQMIPVDAEALQEDRSRRRNEGIAHSGPEDNRSRDSLLADTGLEHHI